MQEPRNPTDTESARRLRLRRHAKRGVIATYIQEISGRRNGRASTERVSVLIEEIEFAPADTGERDPKEVLA